MRITPELITDIEIGQVFVFGSNLSGIHGKGAAKHAQERFGARRGRGVGFCGQSYAIPTRGQWLPKKRTFRDMPLEEIGEHVWDFLTFARNHPELKFLVTKIGCGYAGFTEDQMGTLFSFFGEIPDNVSLPASFWRIASGGLSDPL
jgi:hypothetical protein